MREQVPLEGFDKEQERRLKSKKKSQVYQTEEEKWKCVYRILFPDDGEADIPTPYIEYQPCTGQSAESSSVAHFQEFSRLELPRLVRRTLEAVVEQEAQPLEDKMKERLVDIVKECQSQLLSMFQTISGATYTAKSANAVIPGPVVNLRTTEDSQLVNDGKSCDDFEGFDTPLVQGSAASQASLQSGFRMTITTPKLATSSNSSDSGYDSTWPPAQAPDSSSNPGNAGFPLPSDYVQHEYIDLGGCFDLFDDRMESTLLSSSMNSMMSVDPHSWPFIESMRGMCDVHAAVQGTLEGSGTGWQQ